MTANDNVRLLVQFCILCLVVHLVIRLEGWIRSGKATERALVPALEATPLSEDAQSFVLAEAQRRWKITAKDFDRNLTADLRIFPGEIKAFLDDLDERHDLVIPDDERKRATSMSAILAGLRQKVDPKA